MTITMALGLIIAGFFLLMWSADLLVDNASELGHRLGVSSFLIGIVVIGFGTSAPEMFVSAVAALKNQGNLALGNALGSNITNIGLVLGLAALLRPLPVTATTARKDIPIVITVGAIAIFLVSDGVLSHIDGFFLLALLVGYLVWSARNSEGFGGEPAIENLAKDPHELDLSLLNHPKGRSTKTAVMWTIGSIILLMIASQMLVEGAVTIARSMGVSNLVIGLTIIAIGTSLPELAAAIAAARKGAHDMIIGNIIGSNVFNTLGVLGLTGAIQTTKIDTTALARDFPIMLLFTIAMFLFANSKGQFSRREGASMLTAYVVYICYLVFTTLK
ncbi:MAG: cation:H+ antiporter [Arenicella sp.]|jgi:cation:H+ antiporter